MTTVQQRMGAENYEKMRQWITKKESGGNYASVQNTPLYENGKKVADNVDSGYRGAYQMGASYAKEAGLIKSTSGPTEFGTFGKTQLQRAEGHKAFMNNDANWNDPPGNLQNFLSGPKAKEIQDQAFDRVTQKNYQALVAEKIIKPDTPPDEVAGHLMGAHAAGVTGYKDFYNGNKDKADGAGTRVSTYYNGAAAAVSGKAPPPPGNKTAQNGKPSDDKTAKDPKVKTGSNRSLEATRIGNEVTIGTVSKKKSPIPLPFSNVLSAYSSYNSVITLSCISRAMHSDPKRSYKSGNIGSVVLRSSGAGDLAGQSAIITKENPTGRYDFGINNLEISSLITFNRETQASNGHDITFDVYEPYSMGLFMQVCQNAATAMGWPATLGYMSAVFLLTIEFIGYDSDGKPTLVPNTTRNIPFTFRDIMMTTTAGGSVYKVQAQPSNFAAFLNNFNLFEHDIAVEGSTVQQALQSGERSLQTIVNKRLQEYASNHKTAPTAFDEVIIIFPKINELKGVDQQGRAIGTPIDPTAGTITTRSVRDNAINTETGETYWKGAVQLQTPGVAAVDPNAPPVTSTVSRKTSAANLIQESEDLNAIGKSILQFDSSLTAESTSNDQNDVQVDPANPISRNKVTYDKNARQFQYSQGTSIVNAISSILLHSKYCRAGLDAQKADPKGMIPWFRIESEVHYQEPKEGNAGDGNLPKLLVFKVVPYLVHSEKNAANGSAPAGLAELATEVAKEYDYLYTGKNTEVLGFNIEFKQAMFNAMAKGAGANSKYLDNNGRTGATPDSDTAKISTYNSTSSYWGENLSGKMKNDPQTPESNTNGGLNLADERTLVAQAFQRALNDAATDLAMIPNFSIMGDPYFLADSGLGNFSNTGTGSYNVTENLTMDYQSGEVDIALVFRTPIDYNSSTGLMDFGDTSIVRHFSGLYKVNEVKHRFQNGKFTQELSLMRRRNQTAEAINKPVPVSGNGSSANNSAPVTLVRSTDTNDAVAFSGAAQATAIDRTAAIDATPLGPVGDNTSNQREAAFNRSDLANDTGGSASSATANPDAPGSFGKSLVDRLGIIKNKIVTTLTAPRDTNEKQNTDQ